MATEQVNPAFVRHPVASREAPVSTAQPLWVLAGRSGDRMNRLGFQMAGAWKLVVVTSDSDLTRLSIG